MAYASGRRRVVPTFPNARYLLPRADVEYWDPENDGRYTRVGDTFMANVYADSITPILDACLADQWEGSYVIDENLTVEAAPRAYAGKLRREAVIRRGQGRVHR